MLIPRDAFAPHREPFDYLGQAISGADGRPPLAPKKSVKFVVEDPATGHRSAIWSVFAGRKRDDVYLLEVSTGKRWKTSHHNEGGVWRIAMTSEAAAEDEIERAVLREWPSPSPDQGWREGVAVLVPCAYLRPYAEPVPSEVIRIPSSPNHSAVAVRLNFSEAGTASYTAVAEAFGVGVLLRPGGGTVYVFAQAARLQAWQFESIAAISTDIRESAPTDPSWDRRFVGVLLADDQQFLVDLTVD